MNFCRGNVMEMWSLIVHLGEGGVVARALPSRQSKRFAMLVLLHGSEQRVRGSLGGGARVRGCVERCR